MTTDPLTPARFAELADAYGGTILRWPETVRDEAMRMAGDPAMRALLERAGTLDVTLDRWGVAPPSRALIERIAARRAPIGRRLKLWWSAIGIATALAGAAAGTAAVAAVAHPAPVSEETAFGDLGES